MITVSGTRSTTSSGRFTTIASIMIMLVVYHELSNARPISTPLPCVPMPMKKTGFKGLSRFIGMIDKIISSGNDLEEVTDLFPKNAVSLMTIHKSKD